MSLTPTALVEDFNTRAPNQLGTNIEAGFGASAGTISVGNISIGEGATLHDDTDGSIAIGKGVIVGTITTNPVARVVVLSPDGDVQADDAVAIGANCDITAPGIGGIAIGGGDSSLGAFVGAVGGIAIGSANGVTRCQVAVSADDSVAIGRGARGSGPRGIAIGARTNVSLESVSIGESAAPIGGGTMNVQIGAFSGAAALSACIGYLGSVTASDSVGIGSSVLVTALGGTAIGNGSSVQAPDGVAIGNAAIVEKTGGVEGDRTIVIGNSRSRGRECVILANGIAFQGTDHEFVIGSSTHRIADMRIASDPAAPMPVTFQTTDATGTDVAGASLTVLVGRGTGNATAPDFTVETPTGSTVSGATQQARAERFRVGHDKIQFQQLPVPVVLSQVTGISGTVGGDTALYTVPTGKTTIVQRIILRITAATGVAGDLAAGVGINGTSDDIVISQTLAGFGVGGVDDGLNLDPLAGKFRIADAGEVINLGVDSPDSTATTLTFTAYLIGFLL